MDFPFVCAASMHWGLHTDFKRPCFPWILGKNGQSTFQSSRVFHVLPYHFFPIQYTKMVGDCPLPYVLTWGGGGIRKNLKYWSPIWILWHMGKLHVLFVYEQYISGKANVHTFQPVLSFRPCLEPGKYFYAPFDHLSTINSNKTESSRAVFPNIGHF